MSGLPFKPQALSVLIVDDHDPIRKAIKRVLVSMDFRDIIECFDGNDAIKVLEERPVDLVICDLYMRKTLGFDVISHIRGQKVGSDMPLIVVTGEASRDEIVKAVDFGADDYVLKPFQAGDLEKKVVQVLTKFYQPSPILQTLRSAERNFLHKKYDLALRGFEEACKLDPASMRAVYGRALTFSALGKDLDALELLNETVRTNQSYYKNYAAIADISLKIGQSQHALAAMKQELEINPKQPKRQMQLAKMLLKEGDALGAIDHYRHALRESPNTRSALMGMAQAYAHTDNLEKALYYIKRIRRYHPTATKALELAVKLALDANEAKKAELLLRDEKKMRPERKDTYLVLAKLYAHQKKFDDAIAVLNELLNRDPDFVPGLKMLGVILIKQGDYKTAVDLFVKLADLAPDADIYVYLSDCRSALGDFNGAFEALHLALSINNRHGAAYLKLGDLYKQTGQHTKVYICYRRAALLGADRKLCLQEAHEARLRIQGRRFPQRAS